MNAQRVYLYGSVLFTLLAVVCGYYGITLPWGPSIDFDVLGFLWLLGSAPRLAAIALAVLFAAVAFTCWVRSRI